MSERDFRTWLKARLINIDKTVKAPDSLKARIRVGIAESK